MGRSSERHQRQILAAAYRKSVRSTRKWLYKDAPGRPRMPMPETTSRRSSGQRGARSKPLPSRAPCAQAAASAAASHLRRCGGASRLDPQGGRSAQRRAFGLESADPRPGNRSGLGVVRAPAARHAADRGRRALSRLYAAGDFRAQGSRLAGRATARLGARPGQRRRRRSRSSANCCRRRSRNFRRRIPMCASMSTSALRTGWLLS